MSLKLNIKKFFKTQKIKGKLNAISKASPGAGANLNKIAASNKLVGMGSSAIVNKKAAGRGIAQTARNMGNKFGFGGRSLNVSQKAVKPMSLKAPSTKPRVNVYVRER